MSLKEIPYQQLQLNPMTMIGKDWMLITAAKDGVPNSMTA